MKKSLLSILAILAFSFVSTAQVWVPQGTGFTTQSRGIMNICTVSDQVVWASAYDGTGGTGGCQDFTKTINGGTLWTPGIVNGTTGLQISQLWAIDANTAWVAMYKAAGSNPQGVYKTTNGGAAWTRQTTATFSNSASFPDAIYFWDANTGMVMGDPINGDFEIYTTTDGGTTWTLVPAGQIPNCLSGEYGYTSNIDVIGDHVWFGTNKGRIFSSSDKGLNWIVTTPPNQSGKNSFPAFKDALNGLSLKYQTSADTLLLLDKSVDGGANFTVSTYAGPVYTGEIKYVPNTANTYVTTGVDATNQADRLGLSYSFDGGAIWHTEINIAGIQVTTSQWVNDSTGWIGSFNADPTDGLFKFNSVLAVPVANFTAADSNIAPGGSVHFVNLSTGKPTSFLWTFTGGTPASSTLKNPPPVMYSIPGDYNVTLKATSDFGTNTLVKNGFVHVGGVGISEIAASTIRVYPNPVRDVMNVEASAIINEVQVINMVGQVVLDQQASSKNVSLNTSNLKAGVYTLKVTMENGSVNKKIVIN
jgi:photosystem II stability/assembly factor-like uncharacterized protein